VPKRHVYDKTPTQWIVTYLFIYCLLHARFLLGLFFEPEDGGDVFLRKVDSNSPGCNVLYTLHSHCCENLRSNEWNGWGRTRSLPILRHFPVFSCTEQLQSRQLILCWDSNREPEYKSEALPLEPSLSAQWGPKHRSAANHETSYAVYEVYLRHYSMSSKMRMLLNESLPLNLQNFRLYSLSCHSVYQECVYGLFLDWYSNYIKVISYFNLDYEVSCG
jgi:hypothetical protein